MKATLFLALLGVLIVACALTSVSAKKQSNSNSHSHENRTTHAHHGHRNHTGTGHHQHTTHAPAGNHGGSHGPRNHTGTGHWTGPTRPHSRHGRQAQHGGGHHSGGGHHGGNHIGNHTGNHGGNHNHTGHWTGSTHPHTGHGHGHGHHLGGGFHFNGNHGNNTHPGNHTGGFFGACKARKLVAEFNSTIQAFLTSYADGGSQIWNVLPIPVRISLLNTPAVQAVYNLTAFLLANTTDLSWISLNNDARTALRQGQALAAFSRFARIGAHSSGKCNRTVAELAALFNQLQLDATINVFALDATLNASLHSHPHPHPPHNGTWQHQQQHNNGTAAHHGQCVIRTDITLAWKNNLFHNIDVLVYRAFGEIGPVLEEICGERPPEWQHHTGQHTGHTGHHH